MECIKHAYLFDAWQRLGNALARSDSMSSVMVLHRPMREWHGEEEGGVGGDGEHGEKKIEGRADRGG